MWNVGHRGYGGRGVEVPAGQANDVVLRVVGPTVGDGQRGDLAVDVERRVGCNSAAVSDMPEPERAAFGRQSAGRLLGHGKAVAVPCEHNIVSRRSDAAALGNVALEGKRVESADVRGIRLRGLLVVLEFPGHLQGDFGNVDTVVELLCGGDQLDADRGDARRPRGRGVPRRVACLTVENLRGRQAVVQVAVGVVARRHGSLWLEPEQPELAVVEVGRGHGLPRGVRGRRPVGVHALEHEVVAVGVHDADVLVVCRRQRGTDNAVPPSAVRIRLVHSQRDELVGGGAAVDHGVAICGGAHRGRPRQLEEWIGAVVRDQTVPEDAHAGDVLIEVTRGRSLRKQRREKEVVHFRGKARRRDELGRERVGHDESRVDARERSFIRGAELHFGTRTAASMFRRVRSHTPVVPGVSGPKLGELGVRDGPCGAAGNGENLEPRKLPGVAAINVH